jgi:HSP20 family protein
MTTLSQLREGLSRAWDSLAEGWVHLRERASQALTLFSPVGHGNQIETASDQVVSRAARWGLLPAEVIEHPEELVVNLEVPGIERDALDISVVDNVLVVRGEKRLQREHTTARYFVLECAYGKFERAIPLPVPVDDARARAAYRNGVLRVTLPKASMARVRRVQVKSA